MIVPARADQALNILDARFAPEWDFCAASGEMVGDLRRRCGFHLSTAASMRH